MKICKHNQGFTLIELLVAIGIVGVLSAFAVPAYTGYIDSACISTANANVRTLRTFEENYMVENNTYLAGTHNEGDASSALTTGLHWTPDDDGRYKYVVAAGTTGNLQTSLLITVSSPSCSIDITDGN